MEQKQAWYQHVHPSDVAKEKEYIAFCSDTKLRLHVAELRLNRCSTLFARWQQRCGLWLQWEYVAYIASDTKLR